MKAYIHARLSLADRTVLEGLKQSTGRTESELVRRVSGWSPTKKAAGQVRSHSPGGASGVSRRVRRISTNRKHLEGFGE